MNSRLRRRTPPLVRDGRPADILFQCSDNTWQAYNRWGDGALVGGNSLLSNLLASFVGMIWYFATLTEIPIVEMLTRLGMGKGPALSLLLAGPALSLPSLLVIYKVVGARKTLVFSLLTVIMSTLVGFIFGSIV